ncbi:MAG: NAD(P)-dependent glycerol-3-phosphate dehydrogenase [Victivallaceae bacterium]|nr:NAD(P)-dependent glycerol-3-phosphate dehydrogenase [Victivallaceae bacterium]
MKISVLSDGAWGTALAINLVYNHHEVTIWGPFPDYLAEMKTKRENFRFLPGVKLPDELTFEPDMARAAAGRNILILATPTQFLRSVLEKLKPHFDPAGQVLVDVAKGIEVGSWLRIGEMVEQELGKTRYVALSGPSHAEEVSRRVPTAVVAASHCAADAALVQQAMLNDNFRVYTGNDVIGVELGGALKNVMALAAGIIDGMKLGDNPKAAMMTRGIAEMARLGKALGGRTETFSGLSGIGDLIVTCTSGHSRNRHVGEELGKGRKLADILHDMGMVVAEGVTTAKGAYTLARRAGVETPIIDEIYSVLYEDRNVTDAIRNLMSRSAKPEL